VGASVDKAALLRRHGGQVTAQRLLVLRALSDRPHSAAAKIAALVRSEIGAVSLQAVSDELATITDGGIIRRIQPAGSAAREEHRVDDNRDDLICRTSSRMVDVRLCRRQGAVRDSGRRLGLGDRPSPGHIGADVPTAPCRPLFRPAGDRVRVPRNNRSETALDVM